MSGRYTSYRPLLAAALAPTPRLHQENTIITPTRLIVGGKNPLHRPSSSAASPLSSAFCRSSFFHTTPKKRHLDHRRRTLPPQWRDPCVFLLPIPPFTKTEPYSRNRTILEPARSLKPLGAQSAKLPPPLAPPEPPNRDPLPADAESVTMSEPAAAHRQPRR